MSDGDQQLWTIFVVLLILWLLGFSLHVAGGLIHLLLLVALVMLVIYLVSGRRVAQAVALAFEGPNEKTVPAPFCLLLRQVYGPGHSGLDRGS